MVVDVFGAKKKLQVDSPRGARLRGLMLIK